MSRVPSKPFGGEPKRLALFVVAVGLCTFLLPLVILNPPFMNRSQWTPFDIASAVCTGQLPVAKGHFDEVLIEVALIYGLMPFALIAVLWSRAPRILTLISTVGSIAASTGKFWRHGFLDIFGWDYWEPGRMKIGLAWWILPWIMPVLLALCFAQSLDLNKYDTNRDA